MNNFNTHRYTKMLCHRNTAKADPEEQKIKRQLYSEKSGSIPYMYI